LTPLTFWDSLEDDMRMIRGYAPFPLVLASLPASACSLTGPLDGYATGDRPDAAALPDASSEDTGAPPCDPGYTDCDGDPSNGCEVNLQKDPEHCGSCTTSCAAESAETACVSGACVILACVENHDDCDGNAANGCEVDLTSSPAHCGACNTPCEIQHADPVCVNKICAIGTCRDGWGDCNGSVDDGCETNVKGDAVDHCGACGQVCQAVANSMLACNFGVCVFFCKSGYGDCDQQPSNGCEVDVFNDIANCGTCGHVCSSVNGTPACAGGNCSILCKTNFDNCNNDITDGCETNLQNDVLHCGSCSNACTPPDGASATCVQSKCGFACLADRGNCNNDDADGCETDLLTDSDNCGSCGHSCAGDACTNGYCEPMVLSGTLTSPYAIAVDNTYVYWTDTVDGTVYRQVKDGTLAAEVISKPGSAGVALAVDNHRVYYSTSSTIMAYNKLTAEESTLAADQVNVRAIAVDSASVYWVTGGTTGTDGTVMTVNIDGTNLQALASGQPQPAGIALFGTAVYWSNQGTWTGPDYNNDGSIWKHSSSTNVEFAAPQARPSGLAIYGTSVVWANRHNGSLYRKDTSGGAPVFLLAGQTFDEDLVINNGVAYWTYPGAAPFSGAVMRFPLAAGTARAVAPLQNYPRRVAVDGSHVYWTTAGASQGEGTVYRAVK